MSSDERGVAATLSTYASALSRSDTEAVMHLYAADGVFMAQGSPSAVGADAIRAAYRTILAAITLEVAFTVEEVRLLAPDWAMARTSSAGTVRVHTTGRSSAEANQELFVLQKLGDEWRIARYCFSTTNPPAA